MAGAGAIETGRSVSGSASGAIDSVHGARQPVPGGLRNRVRRAAILLAGGSLLLAAGGCALRSGGPPHVIREAAPELPADFAGSPSTGPHQAEAWWRAFADPALDRVVASVLDSNFSVAEAVARVEQARTRARLADAAILPTLGASLTAETFDLPTNAAIGAQLEDLGLDFPLPDRLGFPTYTLGADFAYEADFWGRVRHTALAAGSELLASEFDLRVARIGILAETISAYFEISHLRQQRAIAGKQVELLEERERLVERRYESGLAVALELHGVRHALAGARAGVPRIENQLAETESRLAVLLGGYREDVAAILPESPAPPSPAEPVPAGIPADLLSQRPDVQAAGHRLEAAGHTVEARRAALMPQLSLRGSLGLRSTDAAGLFDVKQWFANLAGNLLRPVFDGGRLASGVELAEARFDELAAAYGRTIVTAVNEVEAALATSRNEGRRQEALAARREEVRASAELQSRRYASGISGYGDLLDADARLLDAESALASSARNLALARLAIHRALGGAWTAPDAMAGAPARAPEARAKGPADR